MLVWSVGADLPALGRNHIFNPDETWSQALTRSSLREGPEFLTGRGAPVAALKALLPPPPRAWLWLRRSLPSP